MLIMKNALGFGDARARIFLIFVTSRQQYLVSMI